MEQVLEHGVNTGSVFCHQVLPGLELVGSDVLAPHAVEQYLLEHLAWCNVKAFVQSKIAKHYVVYHLSKVFIKDVVVNISLLGDLLLKLLGLDFARGGYHAVR